MMFVNHLSHDVLYQGLGTSIFSITLSDVFIQLAASNPPQNPFGLTACFAKSQFDQPQVKSTFDYRPPNYFTCQIVKQGIFLLFGFNNILLNESFFKLCVQLTNLLSSDLRYFNYLFVIVLQLQHSSQIYEVRASRGKSSSLDFNFGSGRIYTTVTCVLNKILLDLTNSTSNIYIDLIFLQPGPIRWTYRLTLCL